MNNNFDRETGHLFIKDDNSIVKKENAELLGIY